MTLELQQFVDNCYRMVPELSGYDHPWEITINAGAIVASVVGRLSAVEYVVEGGVATHRTAVIERGAVLKDDVVVGKGCFVAAGAYLRGGVYLGEGVTVGPGCEVKSSFIFDRSRLAHFNYVGDSIIGEDVNFEAGAVVANHFNESGKDIELILDGNVIRTGVKKFGALIGDHARIGANAVLDPGSVLEPRRIVGRLVHFGNPK